MAIHHHIKCHSVDDPLEAYAIKMDFNQDIYIISTFNTNNLLILKIVYFITMIPRCKYDRFDHINLTSRNKVAHLLSFKLHIYEYFNGETSLICK